MAKKAPPQSKSKNRNPGVQKRPASGKVRGEGSGEGERKKEPATLGKKSDAKSDSPTSQSDASDQAVEPAWDYYGDPTHKPSGPPYALQDFLTVLREFANGEPLRRVCRQPGYPCHQRVYQWKEEDKDHASRFARACEEHEDALCDEVLDIADDSSQDYKEIQTRSGPVMVFDGEHVQRSKMRIDTRLKWLQIRNNRKFGDKVDHNVTHTVERRHFTKGGARSGDQGEGHA